MRLWTTLTNSIPTRLGMLPAMAALTIAAGLPLARPVAAQEQPAAEGGSTPAAGQVTDPVVTVTVGSINQLTQDLNYLSGAIGQPQLGGMFAMMAGSVTQGIDTNEPVGVIVPLVQGAPEPIALLPTSDIKTVLKRLEAQTGPADELDDGTLVLPVGANTVYIRQMDDWAVLARTREVLDAAPNDPPASLGEMGRQYDLAIKLDMQQVPASIRDGLIAQIRQGFDQAMSQQGEPDESAREMAEQSFRQLEQVISQTDDLLVGFDIDSQNKRIVVDTSFTAVPGSDLASVYQGQISIPSAFSSVIREDAAAYIHFASSISPETVEQARGSLESSMAMLRQVVQQTDELSNQEEKDVIEVCDGLFDLVIESYAKGKVDAGALLLASEDQLQFAMGAFVSDGEEAAKILKDVAEKVEGRQDAPTFEFDRDTYKGVTLHLVEADVPEDEEEARKVIGETLRVHVGTGDEAIYLAVGDSSLNLMMELIDKAYSGNAESTNILMQAEFNLMPVLQYTQSVAKNEAATAMLDALARANDPGKVQITSQSIENGQSSRFMIGDGLLQAIGAAYREAEAKKRQNAQGNF